jgi:hypothetical protein
VIRRPPIAALVFGLLLAGMGAGQLASFGAFRRALGEYGIFDDSEWAAGFVITVELAASLGLLASASAPRWIARAGGVAGLAAAAFWGVLAAQAFVRGLEVGNCGCFGAYLAQPLRWWVLLEDAYLLVLAWYAGAAAGLPLPTASLRLRRTQEAT